MIKTILIALLLLVGVGAILSTRRSNDEDTRFTGGVAGGIALAVCAVLAIFSCVTVVPTREVGVVLTFKKPTGTLTNGFHVKAPWQSVESMDAAIQTDNHTKGGRTSDGEGVLNCITTRIAHQAVACVDVSIRWRIKESQAGVLFQNYRAFENVRDSLVTRDLQSAVNAAMESYDVLAVDSKGQSTAPELSEVGAAVKAKLVSEVGNQIDVLSVIIPVVNFDPATQSRVNALQAQISQTRIAEQSEQTAKAQALANHALGASVVSSPNILVSKCLDLLSEAITKGYQLPAGFNCLGGGSSVGVLAGNK